MSKDVDERIIKMSMENSGFLSKIKQSISSIASLDKSMGKAKNIDLDRSVKGVNSLHSAIGKVSFNGLVNGAEAVRVKFSALQVAATAAFSTIVSRATDAGINLAKSLSIKPMLEGFDMYSNKMKTIQVIQANTGAKTKQITGILADLNDYANKTVYSFEDMTTNLGTFTAAGVNLKTAKVDMIGLSNLAAASGSNTQQAAMAMYQLSQAVAAGKVGLQDWNSVVNAGMGGQKFQNALKQTGMEMGKDIKQSDNFRESLQSGWLTSDVLNKTLEKFANDKSMLKAATQAKTFSDVIDSADDELKSGWAQTWELLVGNYEQAPKLFTGIQNAISNVITQTSNDRNELLEGFNKLGGRQIVIDGLKDALQAMGQVIGIVTKAFRSVFPPETAQGLVNAATSFRNFAENMKLSDTAASQLGSVFRGLFSIIDIGRKVVGILASALFGLIPDSLPGTILSVAAKIGDMITSFDKGLSSTSGFKLGFIDFNKVLKTFHDIASAAFDGVRNSFSGMSDVFKQAGGILSPIITGLAKVIKGLFSAVTPENVAKTGIVVALASLVKNFDSTTKAVRKAVDGLGDAFGDVSGTIKNLYGIKDALKAWTDQVKAKMLIEIAVALLAMAAAIKLLSSLPAVDIAKGLEVLGVALTGLIIGLRAIAKISDFTGTQSAAAVALIISISNALLKLSVAMKILSSIDPEEIGISLLALAAELGIMVGALNVMARIPKGPLIQSATAITILSNGLLVLSASLKLLSTIPFDQTIVGLVGMGGIMAELAVLGTTLSKHPISPATGAALVAMAGAVQMIAVAVTGLALLPVDNLVKGLTAMGYIMLSMAGTAMIMNKLNLNSAAIGVVAMAAAIDMLTPAVVALGVVPFPRLVQGLSGMAIALTEVVAAMKLANGGLAGAGALVVAATGIALLVPPLAALAAIPAKAMAVGLTGLAVSMTIIAVAAKAMTGGAAGLLAFSAAALSLSVVIGSVALAVTAVGAAIGAIGAGLAAFAAALVTLAGLTAQQTAQIGKNFTSLLQSLKTQVPLMAQIGTEFITSIASGLAKAIPSLANSGLKIIVGLLTGVRNNIGRITVLGAEIVLKFAAAITKEAPKLIEAAVKLVITLVNGVANSLRQNSTKIVNAVTNLVEAIFELVIDAGVKVMNILFGWIPGAKGMFTKLGTASKSALRSSFDVKAEGTKGGKDFADGVGSKAKDASNSGKKLGSAAKNGSKTDLKSVGLGAGATFAGGLDSKKNASKLAGQMNKSAAKSGATGNMTDLGKTMGGTYVDALNSQKGNSKNAGSANKSAAKSGAKGTLTSQGSKAGSTYASGLSSKKGDAGSAGRSLASKAKSRSKVSLSSEGSYAGQGFINGINKWAYNAGKAAAKLANNAKNAVKKALGIRSPSREMAKLGDFTVQGFVKGIDDNSDTVNDSSKSMAQKAIDASKAAMSGLQKSLDGELDLNPTITPVLDTSSMRDSASKANNLLAASIGTTPAQMNMNSVKMDTNSLVNGLTNNGLTPSSDTVNLYLTTYGNLDAVTARKWAQPISEALEKVRKNTMRQGGAFA